mmetsp:Transcript_22214/g.43784  ORF Transcript_22214/g.43784 Transcript_22214/m.43784 type:complete len:202 (+) Transcript_22214:508-1113(+)
MHFKSQPPRLHQGLHPRLVCCCHVCPESPHLCCTGCCLPLKPCSLYFEKLFERLELRCMGCCLFPESCCVSDSRLLFSLAEVSVQRSNAVLARLEVLEAGVGAHALLDLNCRNDSLPAAHESALDLRRRNDPLPAAHESALDLRRRNDSLPAAHESALDLRRRNDPLPAAHESALDCARWIVDSGADKAEAANPASPKRTL